MVTAWSFTCEYQLQHLNQQNFSKKNKKFKPTKYSVGGFWTMLMRSYFGQWGPYFSIQGSCQYCNQAFFFFLVPEFRKYWNYICLSWLVCMLYCWQQNIEWICKHFQFRSKDIWFLHIICSFVWLKPFPSEYNKLQGTDAGVDTYFGLYTYPGRELRHRIDLKVIWRALLYSWIGKGFHWIPNSGQRHVLSFFLSVKTCTFVFMQA